MQRNLLNSAQPEYPPIARAAGLSGSVVLQVTIGTNGRVESIRVISGAPMLIQSAINAVKQWQYKPFLLNGAAVEVETMVTVNFELH